MSEVKPREYFLTLKECGGHTHICLFDKHDDRKQLQLIPKSDYDHLQDELTKAKQDLADAKGHMRGLIELGNAYVNLISKLKGSE